MTTDWTTAIADDVQGSVMTLQVTAGAKKAAFPAGFHEWRNAIICSVTAPAVGGKANRAVIEAIADLIGVPASDVILVSGHASPQKRVRIRGLNRGEIVKRLAHHF